MGKYVIDMGTNKQILFFKPIYEEMVKRGHKVYLLSRDFPHSNLLKKKLGLPIADIGSYGTNLYEKLYRSVERQQKLIKWFDADEWDGVLTFQNPDSIRVAYGLGIPVFNFTDLPEANKLVRLTVPLSTLIFTCLPEMADDLRKYTDCPIAVTYCLDPVVWMDGFTPAPITELGIDKEYVDILDGRDTKLAVWRGAETESTYVSQDSTASLVSKLKELYPHYAFYKLERYSDRGYVDIQSLLHYASVLICGGGTMAIEAAWWGTHVISTRPIMTHYDRWMHKNVMCYNHVKTVEGGVKAFEISRRFHSKKLWDNPLRKMKFPLKEIVDDIEKH